MCYTKFTRWRGWPLFLASAVLAFVVCELPIFPDDDYEPNDVYDEAVGISLGTIEATIQPDDDEDYYKVDIGGSEDALLTFDLVMPAVLQPEINIYAAPDNLLDRERAENPGEEIHDTLTVEPGELVVRVRSVNYESSSSTYTLTLTTSAPAE